MKNKKLLIVIPCVILLISFSILRARTHKKYVFEVNQNLKEFIEPYVNDTSFLIGLDRYLLEVNSVNFDEDDYKKSGRNHIRVRYSIYKNEIDQHNKVGRGLVGYNVNFNKDTMDVKFDYRNSRNLKQILIKDFIDCLEFEYRNDEDIYSEKYIRRGSGSLREINIEYDDEMNILSPGYCYYRYNNYANEYSEAYSILYYLDGFDTKIEIPIDYSYVTGGYNLLWDVDIKNIDRIEYDNDETGERGTIVNSDEVITYLKSLPFEMVENLDILKDNSLWIYEKIPMDLDTEYSYTVYYNDDRIVFKRADAVCNGQEYVDKLKKLIGDID